MKWKITHYSIFIAFLCYNFPQNLEFCLDKVKFMFFSQKIWNLWDFMLLKKSPLEKSWSPLDPKNRHGGDKSPLLVTLISWFVVIQVLRKQTMLAKYQDFSCKARCCKAARGIQCDQMWRFIATVAIFRVKWRSIYFQWRFFLKQKIP